MFHYTVQFWSEEEGDTEVHTESGLVVGGSYIEAVEEIVSYYGRHIVSIDNLYELDTMICEDELQEMFPEA